MNPGDIILLECKTRGYNFIGELSEDSSNGRMYINVFLLWRNYIISSQTEDVDLRYDFDHLYTPEYYNVTVLS